MLPAKSTQSTSVIGGVDTHKDLHVAAVVNDNDQVLGTKSFATTRQGYKSMPKALPTLPSQSGAQ